MGSLVTLTLKCVNESPCYCVPLTRRSRSHFRRADSNKTFCCYDRLTSHNTKSWHTCSLGVRAAFQLCAGYCYQMATVWKVVSGCPFRSASRSPVVCISAFLRTHGVPQQLDRVQVEYDGHTWHRFRNRAVILIGSRWLIEHCFFNEYPPRYIFVFDVDFKHILPACI